MAQLFTQQVTGLIKALRNNKQNEQAVVESALGEIGAEIRSTDFEVKAAAVLKLVYLEMLGYPAILKYSFNVLEIMSSSKYHLKAIGYLAAGTSYAASTEVLLLANNLLKKDLQTSAHPSTVILALTSLPALVVASPQLAEDILPDLLRMLTHSKPQIRRIATLTVGKIWCTSYPNAAALPSIEFSHIEKLRSGLSDDDPTVVSATVNVMLELARSRQDSLTSLLGLAPELFDLLTNSTNNWMLIKIAKLFSLLTPVEPRLVRKLLPPLTSLIATTPAFSLLYECIQTVITGGMLNDSDATSPLAQSCIEKLAVFLSDKDQNLRYIALKGLSRLLRNAPHTTSLLARHYDDILACINEEDLTIRLKALELVERLTDRSNCKAIVTRLIEQISPSSTTTTSSAGKNGLRSAAGALRAVSSSYDTSSPSGLSGHTASTSPASASSFALAHYRYRLLLLILRLTSRSSDDGSQLYVNITNFEWYIDTLITCAYLSLSVLPTLDSSETARLASKLSDSLVDVTARAPSIRPFALKRCRRLMADHGFVSLSNPVVDSITSACAFVMGEYAQDAAYEENTEILVESTMLGSNSTGVCLGVMQSLAAWLSDMVQVWQDERLEKIRSVLNSVCQAMRKVEKEEASLFADLIALVISGLDGPRTVSAKQPRSPSSEEGARGGSDNDLDSNPFASSHTPQEVLQHHSSEVGTGAPDSLLLLSSIFAGYELRPLAANAQALVNPPDYLELDTVINMGGGPRATLADLKRGSKGGVRAGSADVDEYGRPKATINLASSSSIRWDSSQDNTASGETTRKDKKKTKQGDLLGKKKSRKKRDQDPAESGEDIDSIPIVKLELSDREGQLDDKGVPAVRRARKMQRDKGPGTGTHRTPSPPPIILSAGGEAPAARSAAGPSRADVEKGPATPMPASKITDEQTEDQAATVHDSAAVRVIKKKKRKKVPVEMF